jgi:hypothetical protein
MALFVLLSKKIIFPEIELSSENDSNFFESYIRVFNDGNNAFYRSVYKFMIIHHFISKTSHYAPFNKCKSHVMTSRQHKYNFLKRNMENSFFQPEDKAQFLDCFFKIPSHHGLLKNF